MRSISYGPTRSPEPIPPSLWRSHYTCRHAYSTSQWSSVSRYQRRASWRARGSASIPWADFVFAFHDDEEIGPRMLARIAKRTGLRPEDL